MIHQASWKALFNLLTMVNKSGNRNISGYTGTMDFEANSDIKMAQLYQANGFLLVVNYKKEITILYNPNNLGRNLLCPANKVGFLVGMGPTAIPIIVDHQAAILPIQVILSSTVEIANCLTINNLAALPTPPTISGGPVNLKGLRTFFPAPFLCNAILKVDSASPLNLVLAGRAAQEEYICDHSGDNGFDKEGVNANIRFFSLWCIRVHQVQAQETLFSVAPDNGELMEWSTCFHCKHILPSLKSTSAIPPSMMDTADLLRSLATDITRTTKEAENQNRIQHKQLDYIKEKNAKKKNKAEKWHSPS
jgi:hypothetical protein